MVKSKIQICFDRERVDKGSFYDVAFVRSLNFKFGENGYYLGFLDKPAEEIKRFYLYQDYVVDIKFPSINYEEFLDYEKIIETKESVPICLGKEVIGKGLFLEWEIL